MSGRNRQPAQKSKLPRQSEKSWQRQVVDLAGRLGWRSYHTWISVHSAAGFPDLVLVRRPRLLFVELKSDAGTVSEAQAAWLYELGQCGQEVYVWRPRDLDEVTRVLR